MRNFADNFWIWLMAYLIYTDITGAAFIPKTSPIEKTNDLSKLNKILIVGANECIPHSQPWQAALLWGDELTCSGVLVHPQWILSSAHCNKSFDTIGLGLHSLSRSQQPGSQMIKLNMSLPHPCFRFSDEYVHDFMLIKLSEPAVISDTVKPIRLASKCPRSGTKCLLSGWGGFSKEKTFKHLQCMETNVISTQTCKEIYHWIRFHKMFCTNAEEFMGSSYGDSGGPVVCNGELQGIISGGALYTENNTDIHIDIFPYKKWIEKIIRTMSATALPKIPTTPSNIPPWFPVTESLPDTQGLQPQQNLNLTSNHSSDNISSVSSSVGS